MTLHQRTRNMASDTDFQFIMGTVLCQKQDSPLFKALEKARITDVGGITSLTNRVTDRVKYCANSSDTPNIEELGHGNNQSTGSFNAFVLMNNNIRNPIDSN